ncbi:hypothetical protein HAX54_000281, partial [Datura stramonium]|nr:hypothetical protein [Datura stramonium]
MMSLSNNWRDGNEQVNISRWRCKQRENNMDPMQDSVENDKVDWEIVRKRLLESLVGDVFLK